MEAHFPHSFTLCGWCYDHVHTFRVTPRNTAFVLGMIWPCLTTYATEPSFRVCVGMASLPRAKKGPLSGVVYHSVKPPMMGYPHPAYRLHARQQYILDRCRVPALPTGTGRGLLAPHLLAVCTWAERQKNLKI